MIIKTKDTETTVFEGTNIVYSGCTFHQYLGKTKPRTEKGVKDDSNFDKCVAFIKEEVGLSEELIKSVLAAADKFFIVNGQ